MKRMGIDIGTTSVSLSVLDRDTRKQVKAETIPGGSFRTETGEDSGSGFSGKTGTWGKDRS